MVLFLASQSKTRQKLLQQVDIPYRVIRQNAQEVIDQNGSLQEQVAALAAQKMGHVNMADIEQYINEGCLCDGTDVFVLTADTLTQSYDGTVLGKPKNKKDAIDKIKKLCGMVTVSTAYVLKKQRLHANSWSSVESIHEVVTAQCEVSIDDAWINRYLEKVPSLSIAGALMVEGYGMQFIKSVHGSYSAILGLPLCELRCTLQRMGFFSFNS